MRYPLPVLILTGYPESRWALLDVIAVNSTVVTWATVYTEPDASDDTVLGVQTRFATSGERREDEVTQFVNNFSEYCTQRLGLFVPFPDTRTARATSIFESLTVPLELTVTPSGAWRGTAVYPAPNGRGHIAVDVVSTVAITEANLIRAHRDLPLIPPLAD
jgi:hypothetical protein